MRRGRRVGAAHGYLQLKPTGSDGSVPSDGGTFRRKNQFCSSLQYTDFTEELLAMS